MGKKNKKKQSDETPAEVSRNGAVLGDQKICWIMVYAFWLFVNLENGLNGILVASIMY